jgi:hypothetical protein
MTTLASGSSTSAAGPVSLHLPSVKLSTFSGGPSVSFRTWLERFELLTEHIEVSARLSLFRAHLSGDAAELALNLTTDVKSDYAKFVAALSSEFDPDDEDALRRAFKSLRLRQSEQFPSFARRVRKAGTRWNAHISELTLVKRFAKGLPDELKVKVMATPPATLDDAVGFCKRLRVFGSDPEPKTAVASVVRDSRMDALEAKLDHLCSVMTSPARPSAPPVPGRRPDVPITECERLYLRNVAAEVTDDELRRVFGK